MMIKNDTDLANYLEVAKEQLGHLCLENVDYATEVESDGYSVVIRMCESGLPSQSHVIVYPFEDYQFDDVLSGLQCFADHLAHEANGKHGTWDGIVENYDTPPLLEDEIAEILDGHKGEEICIMKSPTIAESYTFTDYQTDKCIVFKVYDALIHHYFVTVSGKNIIDL